MRIVIAPDSFKESLSASSSAAAIARGVMRARPGAEVVQVPMADGGEGTVAAMVAATGGRLVEAHVTDPLGRLATAVFGVLGGEAKTAVIEMAAASGLPLVPPAQRNPLVTTTFGTGELIRAALDGGAARIIVGIGGSATVDGGVGAAQALGAVFRTAGGQSIGPGGGALADLASISLATLDPRLRRVRIEVACDVDNPLVGPQGAARVFGPQKGATPAMVETLDANLAHLARVIERDLGVSVAEMPGAGAAGGLGAGLVAFLGARLRPGVDLVIEAVGLERQVAGADLVITGEGQADGQSVRGKTVSGVARAAARHGVPVVVLAGALGPGWRALLDAGVTACFSILDRPLDLPAAVARTEDLLEQAAEQVMRAVRAASRRRG
jgi:glycerate kinase